MKSTYVEFTAKGVVSVGQEEVRADGLGAMEVVIRNEATIISAGTELARLHGLDPEVTFPTRPGYGSVGRIEAVGAGITDRKLGERVFYAGKHAKVQRFTHGENHQWAFLFPVPESVDPIDAAVGCMVEIAMTAPEVTDVALNDTVAVFGLGLVGNLAAQMYALRGARVIGVDPVGKRCEAARSVGIERVIDVAPALQVEAVNAATGGEGADVCVEATGITSALLNCVNAARPFGQVVLVGTPRAPLQGNITDAFQTIHKNGLVVRGAHMWRYPVRPDRNMRRSVSWMFANTFDLIARGRLKVRPLISHIIKPEQVSQAYDGLQNKRDEYTGVVIDWR